MNDKSYSRVIEQLVREAQNGSHEAFRRLVESHRKRLESLIQLRLGARLRQRLEVEDVLQETLLKAHEALPSFRPTGRRSFFQWLGAIAENVIRNFARYHFATQKRDVAREVRLPRETTSSRGDPEARLEGREVSPSGNLRRKERIGRLRAALNKLTRDQREVVILVLLEGLPRNEVARRMNRSVDAISMLLLRSLRRLRVIFGSTESFHLPSHARTYLGSVSMDIPPDTGVERRGGPGGCSREDGVQARRIKHGENGFGGNGLSGLNGSRFSPLST